jgi:hypothetical protein
MKTWDKPRLIVLVRSKPEEVVLGACKGGAPGVGFPNGVNMNCYELLPICAGACSEATPS